MHMLVKSATCASFLYYLSRVTDLWQQSGRFFLSILVQFSCPTVI